MKLPECMLENLETPCGVIDEVLAKENIRRVQPVDVLPAV